MLHLLWSVLDLGLFLSFVFVCYKATLLIRKSINLLAAVLFVFGMLSFVNAENSGLSMNSGGSEVVSGASGHKRFDRTQVIYLTLQKDLLFHTDLSVICGQCNGDPDLYPISAGSAISGLVSGYKWSPSKVLLDTSGGKIRYSFTGNLDWKLMGMTLYTQPEYFSGLLDR